MAWLIVIAVVAVVVFLVCGTKKGGQDQGEAIGHQMSDFACGMTWPEPKVDNLWDSLDFFVRLAEVHSERQTFDTTSVGLLLHVEDSDDHRKGEFRINYFDFESAQRRFGNEIPHLKGKLRDFDGRSYEGFEPNSTAFIYSPEKICEIVSDEAPHAQFQVFRGHADGTLCINFSFSARG